MCFINMTKAFDRVELKDVVDTFYQHEISRGDQNKRPKKTNTEIDLNIKTNTC